MRSLKNSLLQLRMSALGMFDQCTSDFLDVLTRLQFDIATKNCIIRKIIAVTIRTLYIFLRRIKEWSNPELLSC